MCGATVIRDNEPTAPRNSTTPTKGSAMKTALLAMLIALPAAADDLKCEPRKELARALSEKWGETTIFTGAGPNGATIEIFARVNGTWTAIVVAPDGIACPVAAGDAWAGFMIPQGQDG